MSNKRRAVWAVVAVLIVLLGFLAWQSFSPTPRALAPGDVATTTTPFIDQPSHIIDNGQYHEIDAAYPSVTPLQSSAGAEADAEAVAAMRTFAQNTVNTFKESAQMEVPGLGSFGNARKYAMDIDYKLYESSKTVSYVYVIYQDTLGAHPNAYYRTFTFDRANGEAVHLEDLFALGVPYLDRLSERTRADLPVIMARMGNITPAEVDRDYINSGTMPISDSFNNFAIDGMNLLMIFPPYQVGPYVYGTIEVPIPLSSLGSEISPEYRP